MTAGVKLVMLRMETENEEAFARSLHYSEFSSTDLRRSEGPLCVRNDRTAGQKYV